jgi:hypothetical protein
VEEPGVQAGTIPVRQRQKRVRDREDDVDIRHVEEFTLAPAASARGLALGSGAHYRPAVCRFEIS